MQISLTRLRTEKTVIPTAVFLFAAVAFPFLVHLIPPYQGIPMGAYLLPMFYVPFIALVLYRISLALIIAVAAPLISFLISGSPQFGFMGMLTLEVFLFTLIGTALLASPIKWLAAPLGYIGAKVISSSLLFVWPIVPTSPWEFFSSSLANGAPGIIVLLLINLAILRFLPKKDA